MSFASFSMSYDVLENLADHKTDAGFTNAMKEARAQEEANGGDFVSLFINAYHKSAPGHKLAEVFATQQLQGKVSPQTLWSACSKTAH